MFSLIKKIFGDHEEERRDELREKFDMEQNYLDEQLANEKEAQAELIGVSNMQNVLSLPSETDSIKKDQSEEKQCTLRKGIITSLNGKQGVINNFIPFDESVVAEGVGEFDIGCTVEYLSYRDNDCDKVIKIKKIVDEIWGEDIEKQISGNISKLKDDAPIYFNTQNRSVLGLIKERREDDIIVETEHNVMTVTLDDVEIDFVVRGGDRVNLICSVQLDETYMDQHGEILEVIKVEPTRIQKGEKCTVVRVFQDFVQLTDEAYVLSDDVIGGIKLHLGDIVKADLIECAKGEFVWRAIKLEKLEKTFGLLKSLANMKVSKVINDPPISFSGDENCILVGLGSKKTITVKLKNNRDISFNIKRVEFDKYRVSQLQLANLSHSDGFSLGPQAEFDLTFEVYAKYYGESSEYYIISLPKFRIRKVITVVVCENDMEAEEAKKRLKAVMTLPAGGGRTINQRSRYYANQVWSFKTETVPGECSAPKRRFVAVRIGQYLVPEKLRQTYLTSDLDSRIDKKAIIQDMYPCLREELTFSNYVSRFQLLMFLEEIEIFVNFRDYDRERGHFARDGEYLSLTIENLGERRPSIVIGDSVKAINPWAKANDNERCYEGIVHKVLFNRILLKFNASFQDGYNGEDYRLQFFFSRFGLRKQHHAVQRVVKHLGESFLFPTKVQLREHEQLEVRLDLNHDLNLFDSKLTWYNKQLNEVQKRAIYNILRGEVENMPYIIFGPPGTGKTVTLVELILQLVRNLPSSRLLVGAPSNSAADLITQRLIDSGVLQQGEFVRLVSQNQIEKALVPLQLQPYCATADIGSDGTCAGNMVETNSGLKLRCQMKDLGRNRVTISTCTTLGNFLQMHFSANHFSHVIIDEAGQCTEPETIVPITMVAKNRGQVILAGDPHQLQAIVINRFAGDSGYSLSLLERILKFSPYKKDMMRYKKTSGYDPRLMTKLLFNYRALPSIMNVYNELFYDSELVSMIREDSHEARLLAKLQPLLESNSGNRPITHGAHFHGIRCENMQEEDSPSWYNPGEAKSIFLMTIRLYREGVTPEQIGIVTPYMKQVKHLKDLFMTTNVAMPKIGSVEEFQGQERDIILISTVRSTESHLDVDSRFSLGFVRCNKRMNVAISRARSLLIIFGNPHLLVFDECWRSIIMYAFENGAYSGCDLPKALIDKINGIDDRTDEEEFIDEAVL